jgi:hypothetical protein
MAIREICRRAYANELSSGFYFDLPEGYQAPQTPFPFTVRKLERDDFPRIIRARRSTTRSDLKRLIELQILLLEDMPVCYGGFTGEGPPSCMCWLVDYVNRDKLRSFSRRACPS